MMSDFSGLVFISALVNLGLRPLNGSVRWDQHLVLRGIDGSPGASIERFSRHLG
jgi:hypothetical protein